MVDEPAEGSFIQEQLALEALPASQICGGTTTFMQALPVAVKQFGPLVQVFTSVFSLAKAALTCLYSHKGVSSWDTLAQLAHHALSAFQNLPQGPEGPVALDNELKEQLLEVDLKFSPEIQPSVALLFQMGTERVRSGTLQMLTCISLDFQ